MKWKKVFLVMMAVLAVMMVNTEGILADERYPKDTDVEVLYEGNDVDNSYNYYRVAVKFTAASSKKRETPETLTIFEKDKKTGKVRRVDEVVFEDAGKPLSQAKDQSFLSKHDAFYYRAFTAKQNAKGLKTDAGEVDGEYEEQNYEYTCTLTWKNESGDPIIRKSAKPLNVNVRKKLSTELLKVGTSNMFGYVAEGSDLSFDNTLYTEESEYLPIEAITSKDGSRAPMKDNIYGIDEEFPEPTLSISEIPYGVFIGNASLGTHIMYTGDPLPSGSKVKFMLRSDLTFDNSKEVSETVEVPAISNKLTELATSKASYAPEDMYPKDKFEVYMGMGKGPQGSLAEGDNANDVSYILGTKEGVIHHRFGFSVVDESGNLVPGFVFDYFNVKYNPYLFGEFESVVDDGFVKPMGFTMLKSNFTIEKDIFRPQMRISMNKLLGDESDLIELIDFDEDKIKLTINNIEIPVKFVADEDGVDKKELFIDTKDLPSDFLKEAMDSEGTGQTETTFKSGKYEIKMYIPTKLKEGFTMKDYETLVNLASMDHDERKVYPIDLEIIQYEEPLHDREEKLVKVRMQYDIIPYRMPGIN